MSGHDSHDSHGHDDHGSSKGRQSLDDFLADVHPEKLREISGKHEEAHNFAYEKVVPTINKINYDKVKDDELLDLISEYVINHDHKRGIVHKDQLDSKNRTDEFKHHYKQRVKDLLDSSAGQRGGYKSVLDNIRKQKGFNRTLSDLAENMKNTRKSQHIQGSYEKHIDSLKNEDNGAQHMIDVAKGLQSLDKKYENRKLGDLVDNLSSELTSYVSVADQTYKV